MTTTRHLYHPDNAEPPIEYDNPWIFVFPSNTAGIHSEHPLSMLAQKYYGARPGVGYGQESRSFAFPVRDDADHSLSYLAVVNYAQIAVRYMIHRITNADQRYWFSDIPNIPEIIADVIRKEIDLSPRIAKRFSFPESWKIYLERDAALEELLFTRS